MNKIILRVLISVLLIIPFSSLFSQEEQETTQYPKHILTMHPLAIIWGGMKFDYSMRIKERQWVGVMPTVYLFQGLNSLGQNWGEDYEYYYADYDATDSQGFGLDLYYKYYLNKRESFYLLGCVGNHFFHVNYIYNDFIPFSDKDGLPFYRFGEVSETENFNKLGGALSIGVSAPIEHGFYLDFSIGIGYQYSFYDEDKFLFADDYGASDFRYRGFYPAFGFSFGYVW